MIFNLVWIALWLLAAVGVNRAIRVAYFPLWFFAVGMVGHASGILFFASPPAATFRACLLLPSPELSA